jgi:hypothetical protein
MTEARWTRDLEIDKFLETMELPPESVMQRLRAERAQAEAAAPEPGENAPEFAAEMLGSDGSCSGEQRTLADYRGLQLALLLGNYTCPIYRGQIARFSEIYAELSDRLAFLFVYTEEAHPEDGWQVGINHDQCVVYEQPVDLDGRARIAADFIAACDIRIPVALDDMENSINQRYAASPERLYLINGAGVVTHRSIVGPFKLDVIETWYEALLEATGEPAAGVRSM